MLKRSVFHQGEVSVLEFLKGKNKAILGVDISSNSVKLLEVLGNGDTATVKNYAREMLPPEIMDGHNIVDTDAVAACIKKLIQKHKISTKSVSLAVPDSSVISKVIQMNDGLSEGELEELVILEADKYIPYAIDEINIDFEILGQSAKNTAMLDVLIVASRSENVSKRVEAVNKAGLNTKIVDVESFAVERAVQLLREDLPAEGKDKLVAVLDIGFQYTHLFVLENMKVVFNREDQFGMLNLITDFANKHNLSLQEAHDKYLHNDLPDDFKATIEEPFIKNLLTQVKRTLQFFFSTSHHSYVDFILLAGGAARVDALDRKLEKSMGVAVLIANPCKYLHIDPKLDVEDMHRVAPSFLVASGLSLRHVE